MSTKTKVRFAPSPTGHLHIGNARLAVINYLLARQEPDSIYLLRIEDTDPERSKKEYEDGIRKDLKWLGVNWNEEARQSDRRDRYAEVIEEMKAKGLIYPCFESEVELKYKREQQLRAGKPPIYDRAMLKMTPEQRERAEANGKKPYWRFKLSGKIQAWDDLARGKTEVKLASLSDPVVVREDGEILFQLAGLIDDVDMNVTKIVRGSDHVASTGIQLDIAQAMGWNWKSFSFAHLSLLQDEKGGKISKRKGDDMSLARLRKEGIRADAIVTYLARLGTGDEMQVETIEEIAKTFDVSKMSKSSPKIDMQHLLRLNHQAWRQAPLEDAIPFAGDRLTEDLWNILRDNITIGPDIQHWMQVVFDDIDVPAQKGEKDFFLKAIELLPEEPWDENTWGTWTKALSQATERKGKGLYHPLRLALTAEENGPEMKQLIHYIGRDKIIKRFKESASKA